MIQGIIASQRAVGTTPLGPAGNLLFLDFVSGVYGVGGVSVTAAAVIDKPSLLGASGLQIRYDDEVTPGTEIPNLIGAALSAVLTFDWTIVLEYELLDDSFQTEVMTTGNNVTKYERWVHGGPFDGPHHFFFRDNAISHERVLEDTQVLAVGVNKVVVTRQATRLAMSVNGAAVVTDETDADSAPTASSVSFGAFTDEYLSSEFNLRSLTLFAALTDAELPALSTL